MTTRRALLQGAAGAGLATLMPTASASNEQDEMTYVLVHGTWHGGWVWRDVRRQLRARGHVVFTPTCTGCGEREHLAGPDVGLETHIEDVCNVIRFEELENVVLVGHSFAGLTITGVADRMRDRIRHIVFFDALVPRPGRMAGVTRDPETGDYPDWWQARRKHFIDGHRMVLWDDYPVDMLVPPNMTSHVERLKRLITTHPARQWTDELSLTSGGWEGLPRTYIHCVGQQYSMTSDLMVGPARGVGWNFIELDAPRNAMMTHADRVTEILAGVA